MTLRDRTKTAKEDVPADEEGPKPRYIVGLEEAEGRGRSLPVLVAGRRCYACQQADDGPPSPSSDPQEYIDRIAEHCGQTSDYLLADTPLKEAIFRAILAGGNQETTAEDISRLLTEKWAMTAYPRDISPGVIQRLLDHSESYCVVRIPEPEPEEPEEPEEVVVAEEAGAESPTEDSPEEAATSEEQA